jgi:hypothetical protein
MTSLIVVVVLSLLFVLFKKVLPLSSAVAKTDKSIEELRAKYKKLDFIQIGLFFLFAPILTFIYYLVFTSIKTFLFSLYVDTQIVVRFDIAFIIIGFFAALVTGAILLTFFSRRRLKQDWEEYTAYNNLKYGFNYDKVVQISMKVLTGLTIVFLVLFFDWFTIFRTEDVIVNNLFGVGSRTYNYSDISEIRDVLKLKAPNGNIVEDEHYIIVFSDGEKWNSRYSGFADFHDDTRIIELVQKRTRKELVKLEFDRD